MEQLYVRCDKCVAVRDAVEVLHGLDPCDGLSLVATIMKGDVNGDQIEGFLDSITVQCPKCRGTGLTLTAEGRRFAEAVLQLHKGALIV